MNTITLGIITAAILVILGITIALVSLRVFRGSPVQNRLQEFVVSPGSKGPLYTEIQSGSEQFQGSLIRRLIAPPLLKIVSFFGKFLSNASIEQLNWKLSISKNPLKLRAIEFNGLRIVLIIGGIILALLLLASDQFQNRLNYVAAIGIVVFAILLPDAWLNSQVRKAQSDAQAALADAIDMLSVCAYAGLGFDQSLQRVSEYWRNVLGLEFKRVVNEIELGVSRAEALRNMSNRLRIPELTTFVAIIIQADNLGMPTADVLHAQAEQMRVLRQFRAKEIANKLPAKMIMPLAFLILPALLAVIFAPLIPSLMNLFGGF